MIWTKEYLDLVLVPSGLIIMSAYHVFLLYKCLKFPQTTSIGFENHCKKAWVERMLQLEAKEKGLALTVINSTISGATFFATTSLTLSSLIGAWLGSSTHNIFRSKLIYGNTSSSLITIKYISIFTCFLVAFGSFLQCVRNCVHANFLISMPNSGVPVCYVQKAVIRGSVSWSVGLRALYYATTLLLWIFGPIPMFAASVIMVVVLHTLDTNSTPFIQFRQRTGHNFFTEIGEETAAAARVMEHHHRSHRNGTNPEELKDYQLQEKDKK